MATPISSVDGFELLVGYASKTSVKIGVVSLTGGAVTTSFDTGSVNIGVWNQMGTDNPSAVGKYVCTTATVTITGLSAGTKYRGTLSCNGIAINVSFKTLVESGNFSFIQLSCDRVDSTQFGGQLGWERLKDRISSREDHLFVAVIDDVTYAYQLEANDITTGLVSTGRPSVTGLEWDYAIAWCFYYGLIKGDIRSSGFDKRLWLHHNSATWCQYGDNDIASNHGRKVISKRRDEELQGGNPFWGSALNCWNKFIADHACPPKGLEPESPSSQADRLWGVVVGNTKFISPDVNTYIQPYDSGAGYVYGATQLSDIKTYLNTSEKFKVFLSPLKICGVNNEPMCRQDWGAEWNSLIGGGSGLMDNANTNGASGVLVFIAGDTHTNRATKYTANGVDGLGGTGLSSGVLYEFGCGTPNGSGAHGTQKNFSYGQGGETLVERYAYDEITYSTRNVVCLSAVYAEVTDATLTFIMRDLHNDSNNGGPWKFSVGSNSPTTEKIKIGF